MFDINDPTCKTILEYLESRRRLSIRQLIHTENEKEADRLRGQIRELEALARWMTEPPPKENQ